MNSPLSFISKKTKIAKDVVIDPFSVIYDDVEIGEGTWIGPNVTIMQGARIGKKCMIYPGVVIAAKPQDLKYKNEKTFTVIGDNCTIRECVTINRGTTAKYKTIVKNNVLLMAYSHVAHDCIIGNDVIVANGVQIAGHVVLQNNCLVGGLAGIQQHIVVGKYAMIAGATKIRKDIPPYIKVARDPLTFMGINSVLLRRKKFDDKVIRFIGNIYNELYVKGQPLKLALEIIEENYKPSLERDEILSFFKNSKNGTVKKNIDYNKGDEE